MVSGTDAVDDEPMEDEVNDADNEDGSTVMSSLGVPRATQADKTRVKAIVFNMATSAFTMRAEQNSEVPFDRTQVKYKERFMPRRSLFEVLINNQGAIIKYASAACPSFRIGTVTN